MKLTSSLDDSLPIEFILFLATLTLLVTVVVVVRSAPVYKRDKKNDIIH